MNRRLLALLAAIAATLLLLMRIPGHDTPPATTASGTAPPAATTAAAGTSGAGRPVPARTGRAPELGDDSLRDLGAPPPALPGDPGAAAAAFAAAWTRHTGADAVTWTDRLTALATPALARKLPGIDPHTVPADTVTGPPQLTPTPGGADATIATNAGTLQLTLRHLDPPGQWRIDTLGWTAKP